MGTERRQFLCFIKNIINDNMIRNNKNDIVEVEV